MLSDILLDFLNGGPGHLSYKQILDQIDPETCTKSIPGSHTIWEELVHMTIAQEDIIRFTLEPDWQSPPWPEGYWPEPGKAVTLIEWKSMVERFFSDLSRISASIRNGDIDLHEEIPHASGYTYIREILLIIDHNAYHIGKIMLLKKVFDEKSPA